VNVLLRHPDRFGDLGLRGTTFPRLPHLFSLYRSCIFESRAHLVPRLLLSLPMTLAMSFNRGVDGLLYCSDSLRSDPQAAKGLFLRIRGFGHGADRSDGRASLLVAPRPTLLYKTLTGERTPLSLARSGRSPRRRRLNEYGRCNSRYSRPDG
jgi:hypothetical protein